jgi:hypothetical protein
MRKLAQRGQITCQDHIARKGQRRNSKLTLSEYIRSRQAGDSSLYVEYSYSGTSSQI